MKVKVLEGNDLYQAGNPMHSPSKCVYLAEPENAAFPYQQQYGTEVPGNGSNKDMGACQC